MNRLSKSQSDPQLYAIWQKLQADFFPSRPDLNDYQINWSRRNQKRTLASCNFIKHKVHVAKEMNSDKLNIWLAPLLYHEMCHAYLGHTVERAHGSEFKRLEDRHPQTEDLKKWIKEGGWSTAIRSDRAKQTWQKIKASDKPRKSIKRIRKTPPPRPSFIQLVFDFFK